MLFYITEEIANEAEKNNPRVVDVLDFIARSHLYGRHIIFASRNILERLSKLPFFNDKRTTEVFKFILSRYSTFGSIKKVISLHVELILEDKFKVKKSNEGKYLVIYFPITSKALERLMNGTELLGENIEELFIYKFMGEYYMQTRNLQINISYKEMHGGGDTIGKVWENEAKQDNLCLAFLDSDMKYPQGSIGDTLKKVIKIHNEEKYYTAHFIFSNKYREIENMIPLDILYQVSKISSDWLQGFNDIEMIVKGGKDVQYYDMKNGVSLKKYSNLKNRKEEKKYIDMQLSCLYPKKEDLDLIMKGSQETTILLHGLGGDVLKRCVEYMEKHHESLLKDISLDSILEEEWLKIGKEVVNWACAAYPIRS